jgi:hypothetical protein
MEKQLLRDKSTPPGDDILKNPLYLSLTEGLQPEWRYYNDGRAWLCKVTDGRKTIFWFSVWEGFFRVSFYFLPRHLEGLAKVGIGHGRLEDEWGKMIPLFYDVSDTTSIAEIRKVAEFKKKAK